MADINPIRREELADAALFPILRLALFLNEGKLTGADGETLLTEEMLVEMEAIGAELKRTSDCYDGSTVEESFALLVERAEPRSILNDAWELVRSHGVPALLEETQYRFIE